MVAAGDETHHENQRTKMKLLMLGAICAAGLLFATGCKCCSKEGSCAKPAATAACNGDCCKDAATCAKCCKDEAGCKACCKKS